MCEQVNFASMKMSSPMVGDLRYSSHPAVEAQLKLGANSIFVQLKAFDIQVGFFPVCVCVLGVHMYICDTVLWLHSLITSYLVVSIHVQYTLKQNKIPQSH